MNAVERENSVPPAGGCPPAAGRTVDGRQRPSSAPLHVLLPRSRRRASPSPARSWPLLRAWPR